MDSKIKLVTTGNVTFPEALKRLIFDPKPVIGIRLTDWPEHAFVLYRKWYVKSFDNLDKSMQGPAWDIIRIVSEQTAAVFSETLYYYYGGDTLRPWIPDQKEIFALNWELVTSFRSVEANNITDATTL